MGTKGRQYKMSAVNETDGPLKQITDRIAEMAQEIQDLFDSSSKMHDMIGAALDALDEAGEAHCATADDAADRGATYARELAELLSVGLPAEEKVPGYRDSSAEQTRWQDFFSSIGQSMGAEVEELLPSSRGNDRVPIGEQDISVGWPVGDSRPDEEKRHESLQQLLEGPADFVKAVKDFSEQKFQININVSDSGTTATGQITRY